MKSVLISIQPKWCKLIASGKKVFEVRKTKPKLENPFKCYIYCTHAKNGIAYCKGNEILNGKVIGEFICDFIEPYWFMKTDTDIEQFEDVQLACLSAKEIIEYCDDKQLEFWHISDLVIYDTPKSLSEFYIWKKCNSCKTSGYESSACIYDEDCKVPAIITRPPQSWCYVETSE